MQLEETNAQEVKQDIEDIEERLAQVQGDLQIQIAAADQAEKDKGRNINAYKSEDFRSAVTGVSSKNPLSTKHKKGGVMPTRNTNASESFSRWLNPSTMEN